MKKRINMPGGFSTNWIKYSSYDLKSDNMGNVYITPSAEATYTLYNPFDEADQMMIALLKIGSHYDRMEKNEIKSVKAEKELHESVLKFSCDFGLLGFASAGVYNRDIIGEEEVILMTDSCLLAKSSNRDKHINRIMVTEQYLKVFTPFAEDGDLQVKIYKTSVDLVKAEDSPKFYGKRPLIMDLIYSRFYSENLVWLLNFAQMLSRHFDQLSIYANSGKNLTEPVTIMADRFKASKISLTVNYNKRAEIDWEFDSLKTAIQTIYGFALIDENIRLLRCENCNEIFIATNEREKFCNAKCRNRFNVRKSRARKELSNEIG